MPQAMEIGLLGCQLCGKVCRKPATGVAHCPRCGTQLYAREPASVARTWALLIAAIAMYIPANLLPVMRTSYLGDDSADTIISGVVYFLLDGDWPLALIIFTASVLVPLLKILALICLLVSVQSGSVRLRRERTALYRATELTGRWSMVDVFVIALLTALVQSGAFASVRPDIGALAFCAMVILTMLAAMSFDPRLIWDNRAR